MEKIMEKEEKSRYCCVDVHGEEANGVFLPPANMY
jgi:hypothetical protein